MTVFVSINSTVTERRLIDDILIGIEGACISNNYSTIITINFQSLFVSIFNDTMMYVGAAAGIACPRILKFIGVDLGGIRHRAKIIKKR